MYIVNASTIPQTTRTYLYETTIKLALLIMTIMAWESDLEV